MNGFSWRLTDQEPSCVLDRITITTKGKYTALASDAIPPLVELVDDEVNEVRLNALKVTDQMHNTYVYYNAIKAYL